MKMPEDIKIGAFVYSVEYIQGLRDGERKLDGHIDTSQSLIRVEAEMSDQAKVQTILHEVLHGINVEIGRPKMNNKERYIDALAFGIYRVLRDNPDLVKIVLKEN